MSFIHPRFNTFYLLALTALLSAAVSLRSVAEERWVEGQHYQVITPPVAVGNSADVVVTEFFGTAVGTVIPSSPC